MKKIPASEHDRICQLSKTLKYKEIAKLYGVSSVLIFNVLKQNGLTKSRNDIKVEISVGDEFANLVVLKRESGAMPERWQCLCSRCGAKTLVVKKYLLLKRQNPKKYQRCHSCPPKSNYYLERAVKIVECLDRGESISSVSQKFNLSENNIYRIARKERIRTKKENRP